MSAEASIEEKILEAWRENAASWATAVREEQIESRRLVTDRAIVNAILSRAPRSVFDVGCGEGWLARELTARQIDVIGVDAVPELIERAKRDGGGDFRVMTYAEIAAGKLDVDADVVVCNFSLLGKGSVEALVKAVPSLLNERGSLIVQTLHPVTACGDMGYESGWRESAWPGACGAGASPAPWYFRTLEDWSVLFEASGLRIRETREPINPQTRMPVSVLFIASLE